MPGLCPTISTVESSSKAKWLAAIRKLMSRGMIQATFQNDVDWSLKPVRLQEVRPEILQPAPASPPSSRAADAMIRSTLRFSRSQDLDLSDLP